MKISTLIPIVALNSILLLSARTGQSEVLGVNSHEWRASWITSPDAPPKEECVLRFRKSIFFRAVPQHYFVLVSADNQFLLSVNNSVVGTGPSHGDIQHWRYERYDIAPQLKPGANQVAATVWNFADRAPVRQISDRIGFLLESTEDAAVDLRTDANWDVAVERGISTLATPMEMRRAPYFASPAERLDGHSMLWGWSAVANVHARQAAQWKKASLIGKAAEKGTMFANTNWQLVPDNLPAMERVEEDAGHVVRTSGLEGGDGFNLRTIEIPAHGHASILIDRGQLTTAYPELTIGKGDGAEVVLSYAEALYDAKNEKGNRNSINGRHILGVYDEIHPNGDPEQIYMPLEWRTWRYLQIDVKAGDEPVDLVRLRAFFAAYPFEQRASFSSDDATLKPIWEIGWLTARLCAHDTYMDTPYWEQLQYAGDARVQALISYTVAGDDRLARQAIEAFRDSMIPEGILQSRYPSSRFQVIPAFSLQWIGMVHDFWMYRDDPALVRAQLPAVRSILDWFRERQNANGLVGRLPWWNFVDWADGFEMGTPPQTSLGDSAVLSLELLEALRYAADMEEKLGDQETAARYKAEAERISSAVLKLCWDREHGLIADTPEKNHFSQHGNSLAVWLDVVPAADQEPVMLKMLSASDAAFGPNVAPTGMSLASYYYRFYVARAVDHAGLGDRYLQLLEPWRAMVANGLSTWAETPEPTRSDSHAWGAHPNYDLLTTVAGVRPGAAGFKRVHIEPHPGTLHHFVASVPSPSGLIKVAFEKNGSRVSATIDLPTGMGGEFVWRGKSYEIVEGSQRLSLE